MILLTLYIIIALITLFDGYKICNHRGNSILSLICLLSCIPILHQKNISYLHMIGLIAFWFVMIKPVSRFIFNLVKSSKINKIIKVYHSGEVAKASTMIYTLIKKYTTLSTFITNKQIDEMKFKSIYNNFVLELSKGNYNTTDIDHIIRGFFSPVTLMMLCNNSLDYKKRIEDTLAM